MFLAGKLGYGTLVLLVTLPDKTGSQKSKMTTEIMYLHVYELRYMIATTVERLLYTHVSGIGQHSETSVNAVRCLGMLEIKDGGH